MDSTVIIAVISLVGTLGGSLLGILASTKLSNYRIEQLERKVEKHNSVVDRTYVVETKIEAIEQEIREIKDEIHGPRHG